MRSATIIQSMWRGYALRRRIGSVKRTTRNTVSNHIHSNNANNSGNFIWFQ